MVRNAYDVKGLKILNSDDSAQNSVSSVYSGSAKKSASKTRSVISASNSSDNLR